MPRTAREKSKSGIYHIMLRGTNRQEIFHDDDDYARFLETFYRFKKKSEMMVYGWCLMGNHVHLLLQECGEELATTMKRIGVSYAWYYNFKYKASGHLFQDRFRSEKIENDKCLTAALRYIHQNPVKAGLRQHPDEWEWSSCPAYYGGECYPLSLLDSELVFNIFSENRENGFNLFKEFNEAGNSDIFLEEKKKTRFTEEETRLMINEAIKGFGIPEIKALPKTKRNEMIARVKKIDGISQIQLSRIFGISPSLINRAK